MSTDNRNLHNNNIYLVLELFLDPPEIDPWEFKKLMDVKIAKWNRLINASPKYKRFVEIARDFIRDENFNHHLLMEQARTAMNIRLANLNKDIFVAEESGVVKEVVYNNIVKAHMKFFRKETIKQSFALIESQLSQIIVPRNPYGFSPITSWEMDAIDEDLKAVRNGQCRDMYQLLDLSQISKTEDLLNKTKILQNINYKKPKRKAEDDAEARLLMKAAKIFKDELSRKKYDIAFKLRPFDELVKDRFQIRAMKRSVTYQEYFISIKETCGLGFTNDEAQWLVYNYYFVIKKLPIPKRNKEEIQTFAEDERGKVEEPSRLANHSLEVAHSEVANVNTHDNKTSQNQELVHTNPVIAHDGQSATSQLRWIENPIIKYVIIPLLVTIIGTVVATILATIVLNNM